MRGPSRSSPADAIRGPAPGLRLLLAAAGVAAAVACGEAGPDAPPAILREQPADQAVFEGQSALFEVRASGTAGLTYQWRRNGVPIPGATDSHLATRRTVPGDDGATYSVAVTNSGAAPVESRAALLTVHPPLDLRFQWVSAPDRPSYGLGANIMTGWRKTFPGAGSPLLVGSGFCGGTWSCDWYFAVDPTVPGMTIAYEAGALSRLEAGWAAALPSDTVVTSLDLQEASDAYAMSLSQTTQVGEFTPVVQGAVALDQLQAVASAEGAQGRVLTAVSYRGGLVTFVSHGWSLAPSAVYEAQVVATTFGAAVADARSLAAQGYVLTACGAGDAGARGLLLVGTRAVGDTAPRSIVTPENVSLLDGHALVAFLFDPGTSTFTLIGER